MATESINAGSSAVREPSAEFAIDRENSPAEAIDVVIFGMRGIALSLVDDASELVGHMSALSRATSSLCRLVRIAELSNELTSDEAPRVIGQAQDGIEFLMGMLASISERIELLSASGHSANH